jgi:hypothetical protein
MELYRDQCTLSFIHLSNGFPASRELTYIVKVMVFVSHSFIGISKNGIFLCATYTTLQTAWAVFARGGCTCQIGASYVTAQFRLHSLLFMAPFGPLFFVLC